MLLFGLPHENSSGPPGRKQDPAKKRGLCIVRLFDEQRVLFGYGFPVGWTPPKIVAQHTTLAGILQHKILDRFFYRAPIISLKSR